MCRLRLQGNSQACLASQRRTLRPETWRPFPAKPQAGAIPRPQNRERDSPPRQHRTPTVSSPMVSRLRTRSPTSSRFPRKTAMRRLRDTPPPAATPPSRAIPCSPTARASAIPRDTRERDKVFNNTVKSFPQFNSPHVNQGKCCKAMQGRNPRERPRQASRSSQNEASKLWISSRHTVNADPPSSPTRMGTRDQRGRASLLH